MSVIQGNQIFIVSGTVNVPTFSATTATSASASVAPIQTGQNVNRRRFKTSSQQSLCDLIVVLVALPTLTVLGLMLESMTRENWLDSVESRFTVLGLGAGLAIICLALCMYVTSRLGKRFLWVGMQFSDDTIYSYYNPRAAATDSNDLPPKYDVVMGFDLPPPAYETIIDVEKLQFDHADSEKCPKEITIQHI